MSLRSRSDSIALGPSQAGAKFLQPFFHPINFIGLLFLLSLSARLPAPEQPKAQVVAVADLLAEFRFNRVTGSSSSEVRRPAVSGGVKKDALFEHPATPGRPARIEYDFMLPRCAAGERLFLAFEIALADGVKLGEGEDGVRFIVELDGTKVFSEETHECRWRPYSLDLTAHSGRQVKLALLTDAITNTRFDWAVWGNPRVLYFRALSELMSNTEVSHAVAAGFKPKEIIVDGRPLPESHGPPQRTPSWWWDQKRDRLYLAVPHSVQSANVEMK